MNVDAVADYIFKNSNLNEVSSLLKKLYAEKNRNILTESMIEHIKELNTNNFEIVDMDIYQGLIEYTCTYRILYNNVNFSIIISRSRGDHILYNSIYLKISNPIEYECKLHVPDGYEEDNHDMAFASLRFLQPDYIPKKSNEKHFQKFCDFGITTDTITYIVRFLQIVSEYHKPNICACFTFSGPSRNEEDGHNLINDDFILQKNYIGARYANEKDRFVEEEAKEDNEDNE